MVVIISYKPPTVIEILHENYFNLNFEGSRYEVSGSTTPGYRGNVVAMGSTKLKVSYALPLFGTIGLAVCLSHLRINLLG